MPGLPLVHSTQAIALSIALEDNWYQAERRRDLAEAHWASLRRLYPAGTNPDMEEDIAMLREVLDEYATMQKEDRPRENIDYEEDYDKEAEEEAWRAFEEEAIRQQANAAAVKPRKKVVGGTSRRRMTLRNDAFLGSSIVGGSKSIADLQKMLEQQTLTPNAEKTSGGLEAQNAAPKDQIGKGKKSRSGGSWRRRRRWQVISSHPRLHRSR